MMHLTEAPPAAEAQIINLPDVAATLLEVARTSQAGRAGRTLIPGAGAPLKQTVMALVAGQSLADHESPGAATLQVLAGAVLLTGGGEAMELHTGDHAAIPPVRHGLVALDDAVVLISVGQGVRPDAGKPARVGLPD
jgi:quercetin dioxygenase-like cupin family protein